MAGIYTTNVYIETIIVILANCLPPLIGVPHILQLYSFLFLGGASSVANFLLRHSVVCDTGVELSDGGRRRGSIYRAWESLVSGAGCASAILSSAWGEMCGVRGW